ncbi:MAG: hypothetical protein ACFHWX_09810 [Bacteroidota bacterium]
MMKTFNNLMMIGVAIGLLVLSSCLEEENPCPDAIINVSVDSTDFSYTITAEGLEEIIYEWRVNGNVVETEELNDLRDNLLNFTFEPGTYNICISGESELCGGKIEFCKEITISSNPCPELKFEYEQLTHDKYLFEANFDGRNDVLYTWYVDGDSIETAPFGEKRWHAFDYVFEVGAHEVCIKPVNSDCEHSFCKEIIVEEAVCPQPSFIADQHEGNEWLFTADFEGKNDVLYKWYVNGDLVDKENFEGHETDHKLLKDFVPGTYNVCVVAYADWCEPAEYCKEIVIEEGPNDCIAVSYTAERDGDALAYNFLADFEGKNDVTYIWKVFVNDDYQGGEVREAGSEDDHAFYWQFEQGVTYEVCLIQDGGCVDKQVCKTFKIE